MATRTSGRHLEKRGLEAGDICHLESKALKRDDMVCVSRLDSRTPSVSKPSKGKASEDGPEQQSSAVSGITILWSGGQRIGEEVGTRRLCKEVSLLETSESSDDELGQLDIDLDRKSKQHNLTSSNVLTILHEVITHEHVVAMMKAAIKETQDLPMFEHKMTRSRLKQVVAQGEVSPVKGAMAKPPQFVDIILEEEDDSSDEEYCPDEDEEDETAEESFLSDVDSMGSSPRMPLGSQPRHPADQRKENPSQRATCSRHLRVEAFPMASSCAAQHPLTAPTDSAFLERLHAVEEELASNPTRHSYQPLNGEGDEDASGLAYRTRSKRPLVDVPLGQLEAELLAPDITDDMYDQGAILKQDPHWTEWLQGLMASDNEEEGDDEDDPEYNFLDDLDEPDLEDYRTDRAVRITKKEVNELLEELFDTFQEELGVGEQEEEVPLQTVPKFNVPQALRFEAPLASMLTERRRAVRQQYEALQQKRALQDTPSYHHDNPTLQFTPSHRPTAVLVPGRICPALYLDHAQKLQLQQQVQQHVQLLTQVHLLSRHVDALNHEACITKQYLEELQQFSRCQEKLCLTSSFRGCNLQGALDLLQELQEREESPGSPPGSPPPGSPPAAKGWLPRMSTATNSRAFPLLLADTAWLLATRSVFLYPELLPVCSLDPSLHPQHPRTIYTNGEDCLIVLGLKHFEETVLPDQLLSSYLVCKRHQNLRKHISEMCGPNAPQDNVIKWFCQKRVVPPMPVASRVLSGEQRLPVDREKDVLPNWLKKSQHIIQKTKLASSQLPCYPRFLPRSCILRLHPSLPSKPILQTTPRLSRTFTLAHTASLPPLAKTPGDRQQIGYRAHVPGPLPSQGVILLAKTPSTLIQGALPLAEPPAHGTVSLAAVYPVSAHPVCSNSTSQSTLTAAPPIGQRRVPTFMKQSISKQPDKPYRHCSISTIAPPRLLLPALPFSCKSPQSNSDQPVGDRPSAIMPSASSAKKPDYILGQMLCTPRTNQVPNGDSRHLLDVSRSSEEQFHRPVEEKGESSGNPCSSFHSQADGMKKKMEGGEDERRQEGEGGEELMESESLASTSTLSPLSSPEGGSREEEEEEEERNWTVHGVVTSNGGGEEQDRRELGSGGGGEEEPSGEREGEHGGEEQEDGERDDGQSGGERDDDGEKDGDGEQDRQGEEEEEEDFDDLTQDEDEEEVMSSASEESVLSVPELQETMKQLTWLASEGRLCGDADSEEDHSPTSPTSPGSQEENSEEEEEGPAKGEESGEGRSTKVTGDEETPSGEGTPRGGGRGPGRGRGRARPPRGLRRSRQERHSKDSDKLLLLYDDNILDNDPHRESKDIAFAQSYLNRVREVLQDAPGKVEEFLALLYEFDQVGEGQDVVSLLRRLRCILGDQTDLLRDFAAFLHPEQALECGLFEEQQAFERSRRFLRQLEISFGENPSHYQKIIKALQAGPDLSPASIHELKAQMVTLLKGHTHLQGEFWVFFDELRPPPARPGQFEEAHWPEEGGGGSDGGEAIGSGLGGGASSGFEEVTLPELEEEEEGHKIQPMVSRRRRRKIGSHSNYKECDWSEKDWPCLCHDAKIRRHKRKGNKTSVLEGVSRAMKSLDPLYSQLGSVHDEQGVKDRELDSELKEEVDSGANSPQPEQSVASWEGSFPLADEKEEEDDEMEDEEEDEDEEERKNSDREHSPLLKKSMVDEESLGSLQQPTTSSLSTFSTAALLARPSPPPDLPVCAKNISLTASGEKVILWTREADRVILTTCQQEGANQNTFQAISTLLGNKTPNEVSRRFRDLMRLFRTAARQTSSEDEAPPTEPASANEEHEEQE